MSGFIYSGKSTNNIISDKLILAAWDFMSETSGSDRSTVIGARTITRPIANEYGTTYSPVSFSYILVKENGEPITEGEQAVIETWLTSPKFSSTLTLIDACDGTEIKHYKGKFVRTSWTATIGGWASVNFTFECVSPYAYEHHTEVYDVSESETITLNLDSDETEEYVYPVLKIYTDQPNFVAITNMSDNGNAMVIDAPRMLEVRIDCDKCLLTDGTGNDVISFEDIGWSDIGNIYWLRLHGNGENVLTVTGSARITIEYDTVNKMVGGWL